MKRNKRGDVSDVFVVLLIGIFLAISFVIVLYTNTQLRSVISDTALNDTSAAPSILSAFDNINNNVVQRGYALMMGLLIVGVIVSSFLIRVHPAFLFLYIITTGVAIFVSVYLGNLYSSVAEVSEFAAIAAANPMITWFMQNIVMITLGVGVLSMIVVFSKIYSSPGAGGGEF